VSDLDPLADHRTLASAQRERAMAVRELTQEERNQIAQRTLHRMLASAPDHRVNVEVDRFTDEKGQPQIKITPANAKG
jgi:hypothetical protein